MCILCVISRWSRRIMTMLPWIIIPFIIIWALSQLLPPGFRLEVTSPRLACLAVLLSSLGWYELIMPRLSSWQARRSALLRERKRIEAQEAVKWRKEATRRCRNCLTAYKVQTPGGGRFMCTYCGHVSKRPVLEVPGRFSYPSSPGFTGTSFVGAFSGGQLVNGARVRYFGGPWRGSRAEVGSWPRVNEGGACAWFGTLLPVGAGCLYSGEGGLHGPRHLLGDSIYGGEKGRPGKSLSGTVLSFVRILSSIHWVWRTVLGKGHPNNDGSADGSRDSQRKKEDLDNIHGSRGEKARRKAKERKQVRLEKELLEAEERKQREEVAHMVEERRRQREEKLEVEKESERQAVAERERELRRVREMERRRKEKAKEGAVDPVKSKTSEQCPEDATIKNKTTEESDGRNATSRLTPVKDVESDKNFQPSRGLTHDRGLRWRGATDNRSRVGFSRQFGTAKRGFLPTTKMGTPHMNDGLGRTIMEDVHARGKFPKPTTLAASGSLNASQKSIAPQSFGSAWKKVPWTNVLVKGSEALTGESHIMQTGMLDGTCQGLDQNKDARVNPFGNESVVKPSLSPVGVTAIQPPIAPPANHLDSLHQLFSSPSIFSPLDLAVDFQTQREPKSQPEIKIFFPGHTFFETFQPCEPSAPLSLSASPQTSIPVQSSFLSPLNPSDAVPHNSGGLTCMDIPQSLLPLGPVSDLLPSSFPAQLMVDADDGIKSNPISPSSLYVPDPSVMISSILSPTSKPIKTDGTDLPSDKDDLLHWDLPSLSLEDSSDTGEGTRWQMIDATQLHEMKISTPSTFVPNDEWLEQDAQLPHVCTVQSPSDPENRVSQRSVLLQEQSRSKLNGDETSGTAQVSDKKSCWSDISAFNATLPIWDDSDIHQKVPPEFVDCITQEIMEDPVITADGHSYERAAIEKWLKLHDTSPKTGEVLPPPPGGDGFGVDKTLRPNHILRGQIIEYKERLARMSDLKAVTWSIDGGGFFKTTATPSVWSF